MNRKKNIIILSILIIIAIFVCYGFWNYSINPRGLELYKGMFIFVISWIFLIIFLNLSYNSYKYLFFISFIISLGAWIYKFLLCYYFSFLPRLSQFYWDFIIIFSVSCIAPFFSVHSLFLITKNEHKFENNVIKERYHLHEGFAGIILILIAIGLSLILFIFIPEYNVRGILHLLGAAIIIITILIFYFGGFLVGRDWQDVKNFKFLAINSYNDTKINGNESLNNKIKKFYTKKHLNTYLLGIIITSLGIFLSFFPNDIFPYNIFFLKANAIRIIGWIILVIGALTIGNDWVRILHKFFPEKYEKLFHQIENKVK